MNKVRTSQNKVSVRQNNSNVRQNKVSVHPGKCKPARVRLSRKPVLDVRVCIIQCAQRNSSRKVKPLAYAMVKAACL